MSEVMDSVNEVGSKGVLVFYVAVASLPTERALALVDKYKEHYLESEKTANSCKLPKDITILFVPVRCQKSRVEYIKF